jgi:Cu2+-exporting ATPase
MDAYRKGCAHCGLPVPAQSGGGADYCCAGCEAAYLLLSDLGLERYYDLREIDPRARPLKPDEEARPKNFGAFAQPGKGDTQRLDLMVDGLQCAACVWLIENVLAREPGVESARVNLSTRRLALIWRGDVSLAEGYVAKLEGLGYQFMPFDAARLETGEAREERMLLRAMAVAGFAAGNVMLLSVAVWAGAWEDMGEATRGLMHWISALIAVPAVAYAGRPFFRAVPAFLAHRRVTMDLPISLAVILTLAMSLFEAARGGAHVYFDSACALLFFLLIGRYLDRRARGRARAAVAHLLALGAGAVTVLENGLRRLAPIEEVRPGMTVLVAAGENIAVDGEVSHGISDLDTSLITGESLPRAVAPKSRVFAGMINLTAPLRLTADAVGEKTLLAEIVRLMELAEQGRARFVAIADRVARLYTPAVHGLALGTFLGWLLVAGAGWQVALLNAVAVLIVTCPCALGLAVPMVQVIAAGRLLRRGIFLKSATALERLAEVDMVVFDKTGTLTLGRLRLLPGEADERDLARAAALAGASRHPLARALAAAVPRVPVAEDVAEFPGQGLSALIDGMEWRLGNRAWCGVSVGAVDAAPEPELWLKGADGDPVRFAFADELRPDAAEAIAGLRARGLEVALLSGDHEAAVGDVAARLGIVDWQASCRPDDKARRLADLARSGRKVMMVGDGLNDAPALAAAHVSASPSGAAELSQMAADAVFQGERLAPVIELLDVARRADRLVKQNITLAFSYNAITVPLAMLGFVTPLIAAAAMSCSSLVVIANALRLARAARSAAA